MKKLTLLFTAIVLIFSMSAFASAQAAGPQGGGPGAGKAGGKGQGPGGRQRMNKMRAEIIAKLNLSKDQKAKSDALDKKFEADIKKLMESSKGDRQAMRSKGRELSENREKEFIKILKPDQEKKYKELRKQMMDKMRSQMGRRGGAAGGAKGGGKGG